MWGVPMGIYVWGGGAAVTFLLSSHGVYTEASGVSS